MSSCERRRKKIDISAFAEPLVQNPFAAIPTEGLPEGIVTPVPEVELTEPSTPTRRGRVVLRREKSGRSGKTVTVLTDFDEKIQDDELEDLARRLRKACGCGGAVKEREIEIQGEPLARLWELLQAEGFRVAGVRA